MSQTNHEVLPYVTGVVQDFGNCDTSYVANGISPRVKVARREFAYREFNKTKPFNKVADADMIVGDYAQVIEIEANTSELKTDATQDRGIENPISWHDFSESGQPCSGLDTDITARHATYLMHKYMLAREARVAGNVQTVGNYTTGNAFDLLGNQIVDPTAPDYADPLTFFTDVIASAIVKPNIVVFPERVWAVVRQQNSINGSTFTRRLATEQEFATLFGLDQVLVAKARYNNAGSIDPVWTNDAIVLAHVAPSFDNPLCPTATFSFSASVDGDVQAWAWETAEKSIGLRGGVRVRVGEGIKEKYFYEMGQIIHNFALTVAP